MLLVPTCINLNNIMLSEKTLQKQLYSMIPFIKNLKVYSPHCILFTDICKCNE